MERAGKLMGAAAVILNRHDHVLLVKHTYGKRNWELPGGRSEPNESVAVTAVREVHEETGLQVSVDRMVGRTYYDPQWDMHHFLFVCRQVNEADVPVATPPETSDCGFWPVDDLPRPISDFTVQRIRDAVAATGHPCVVEIGPRVWIE